MFHPALSAVWLRLLNHNIVLVQVFGPDNSGFRKKKKKKKLWDFEVAALCHPASAGISMTKETAPYQPDTILLLENV